MAIERTTNCDESCSSQFGISCPRYLRSYQTVEAVAQDYRKKSVGFFYVYQTLAHPENHGYVNAFKIEERFMQIEHAERTLGTKIDVKTFFAGTPNSMFVLDREGKIVFREPWSDGDQLRDALANLKGPVANPTNAADLKFPYVRPVNMRFEGVVARIRVDEPLNPVKFTPGESDQIYYAKLKPEVNRALLSSGSGKIYLGFHLDKVYNVHWNNLAEPLRYEITPPDGVTVTPSSGEGARAPVETDIDPREFLIDVRNWADASQPLNLKVDYFACNKAEGWCRPVTQNYAIFLQPDRFGGRVIGRSFRGGKRGKRGRRGRRF